MGVKCVFYKKCKSDSDKTRFRLVMFHKFPDARKDEKRYKKWMNIIPDANSLLSTSPTSRYVCSLHFKEDDYLQPVHPVNGRLRLKRTAVPSIFILDDIDDNQTRSLTSIENVKISNVTSVDTSVYDEIKNEPVQNNTDLNNFSPINEDTTVDMNICDKDTQIHVDEKSDQLNSPDLLTEDQYYKITIDQNSQTENNIKAKVTDLDNFSPTNGDTTVDMNICDKDTQMHINEESEDQLNSPDLSTEDQYYKITIDQDSQTENNIKAEVANNVLVQTVMTGKDLSAKLLKSRQKVNSLQRRVRVLNKNVIKYKTLLKSTKIEANMEKKMRFVLNAENESIPVMLFNNELRNHTNKIRARDYTEKIKNFCAMLYKHSPKAYNYIRERSTLPHPKTVRTWQSYLKTKLISNENIDAAKENLEELVEEEEEEDGEEEVVVENVEDVRIEDLDDMEVLEESGNEDSDLLMEEDEDRCSEVDSELNDDIDDYDKDENEIIFTSS